MSTTKTKILLWRHPGGKQQFRETSGEAALSRGSQSQGLWWWGSFLVCLWPVILFGPIRVWLRLLLGGTGISRQDGWEDSKEGGRTYYVGGSSLLWPSQFSQLVFSSSIIFISGPLLWRQLIHVVILHVWPKWGVPLSGPPNTAMLQALSGCCQRSHHWLASLLQVIAWRKGLNRLEWLLVSAPKEPPNEAETWESSVTWFPSYFLAVCFFISFFSRLASQRRIKKQFFESLHLWKRLYSTGKENLPPPNVSLGMQIILSWKQLRPQDTVTFPLSPLTCLKNLDKGPF